MAIIQTYLTENPCYKSNRSINVKGLMLHSIGVPQPNPLVLIKNWNSPSYDRACVHGFIGEKDTYITLPIFEKRGAAHRGWHGASGPNGSVNNTHIGVEMCEPKWIKYTGGSNFTCSDYDSSRKYVEQTTQNAVELFAKLCEFHDLDPLAPGVIISHAEGHKLGLASNHGDPDHLWRQLKMNYNMDSFRQDVYNKLNNLTEEEDMDVNRFKELYFEMRKELQDNDASSWSEEARNWAISSGLIQGNSGEHFNGLWEDVMTREQFITVLYRFAKLLGKA